jgi:hypothetical protein
MVADISVVPDSTATDAIAVVGNYDRCSFGTTDQTFFCFWLLQCSAPDQSVDPTLIEWEAY